MRGRSGLPIILVIVIFSGCANSAFSQVSASVAQLDGTVRDEKGGVIPKASISLREMDTNRAYSGATNDSGFYVVPNLLPGRYELKVGYTGFANFTQTGILLSVGQTATVNVTLKVAALGEEVTVTGEAPPIEPTRTEISQVVDR